MEVEELKNSGNLEAYVCGVLPADEARAIASMVAQHQELQDEVEHIENTYFKLAAGIAPSFDEVALYDSLREYIKEQKKDNESFEWKQYLGWAAALILFIGSSYLFYQNNQINEQLVNTEQANSFLNEELEQLDQLNADYQEALAFIKKPATVKVSLAGQGDYKEAYAVAFHNDAENKTYVDISGLPEPPEDMTYQLWSLTLNPLAPSSLGIMAYESDNLLEFDNQFNPQAFGITLEKAGGSTAPTLERLYTLGVIE